MNEPAMTLMNKNAAAIVPAPRSCRSQTGAPRLMALRGLRKGGCLPRCLRAAFICLFIWSGARAEVGTGLSLLFNVDTRWGFGTSSGFSGFFTVDTRFSGSTGDADSGWFTVDTRGADIGSAIISGRVTDDTGTGLMATVTAQQNGVVRAQTVADFTGAYSLASLPEGTYMVQASQVGYLPVNQYGVNLAEGQTLVQNFSLTGKPPVPGVVPATVPPPAVNGPFITGTLELFDGSKFVPVAPGYAVDQTKPTVILTHGWNSASHWWPADMAKGMIVGGANATILAWDWPVEAGTGLDLGKATSATAREGRKLGEKLSVAFTPAYQQGVHFVGHSLGSLVNGTAANYLHANGYSWTHTHVTLLDDAEEANWVSSANWVSPIPDQHAWIDNYVSLVGFTHREAVNIWLVKSPYYGDASDPKVLAESVHAYACRWYSNTTATPNLSLFGNRYSFEQLGSAAQFPSPTPYPSGTIFSQDLLSFDELALKRLNTAAEIVAAATVWSAGLETFGLGSAVNFAKGLPQKLGTVAADVVVSLIPTTPTGTPVASLTAGSTTMYYADNPVQIQPVWSFEFNLQTTPPLLPRPNPHPLDGGDATTEPPCIWVPVAVPKNAALFCFDFTFNGNPVEDIFSSSIAGTNVFALEAKFMPTNTVLNSGPVDVTAWAGKTVDFFFGLLGGTSTNASLTLNAMRFYQVEGPALGIQIVGGEILLSWAATVQGYELQSTPTLTVTNQWSAVTNMHALAGLQYVVTNSISSESKFYRLAK